MKALEILWAVIGIACIAGVIFCGAWWQFFTAVICLVMFAICRDASNEEEKEDIF